MSDIKPKFKSKAYKDLVILGILLFLIFIQAVYLDEFTKLAEWSRTHDTLQFDEIFTVLIFASLAFAFYSFRRWRELKIEISERLKAEKKILDLNNELRIKIDELNNVNKELEAFNYMISHDLRNPLQLIGGFSQNLLKNYNEQFNGEIYKRLSIIHDNSCKMEQLIDLLLDYSRLGRQSIRFQTVDLYPLANKILEEQRNLRNCKSLETVIQTLPKAKGDPVLIGQVLTNLISNALKYSRQSDIQRIEIGGMQDGPFNIYYVKDNGVGFDPGQQDRLFKVFQRLHDSKEFEGNGIGLSIVSKIIEQHGGKVWAKSNQGKGAEFYFTLPACVENQAVHLNKSKTMKSVEVPC